MSRDAGSTTAAGPEAAASPGAPSLPDVNDETHPFARVQGLLDDVAQLNLFARPAPRRDDPAPTLTPYAPEDYFGIQGGYGLVVDSNLHRFETRIEPGTTPRVGHSIGWPEGSFHSRWLTSTEALEWSPGTEPPAAIFDPWRAQPFAMLDCEMELGERGDGFRGYGVGRTFPLTVDGRPRILAAAVGTLLEGRGRLEGMDATFSLNGEITGALGFQGDVTVRLPDPGGGLRTEREIATLSSGPPFPEEDGAAYFVLRGEKEHAGVRTEYGAPPGPGLVSLVTPARMRTVVFPVACHGRGGLRTGMEPGREVARLQATVALDILAPPGTVAAPNDFTTRNVYTFFDAAGEPVGTIEAQVVVGKSFDLTFPAAPDQPAMRYGGFGPILSGTGPFAGAQGTVSLNSAIGVAPHALSMINVIRLVDSQGRFRSAGRSPRRAP